MTSSPGEKTADLVSKWQVKIFRTVVETGVPSVQKL